MALAESATANTEHPAPAESVASDAVAAEKAPRQVALKPATRKRLSDSELDIARKLSFSAALDKDAADDSDDHKVQIVIRIRPLAPEDDAGEDECFRVVSETALLAHPPKTSQSYRSTGTATSFHFARIFTPQTQQPELFEATTKPVLEAAFAGKNGLVFAYGVTNSGKTYTITGTEENAGVLPRALRFVLEELGRRKENEETPVTKITASYVEIYNENVYDLLSAPVRKRRALRLQDCDGKIQVRGMVERPLKTLKDAEDVLATGQKSKQVAETNCNMDSSRSHCIFSLYFYHRDARGATVLRSKVSIVDLAGSERSAKTGATGLRMQEASKINGSLMNLMRCLETMRWNQQHPVTLHKMVPFRESKLTRLFQENLIGRKQGPLVMIVAVNPSSHEFDETLRTLKYSAMARELVPVQKHTGRKSTASSYYDLDGRLRKRRRTSTEPETAAGVDEPVEPPVKREPLAEQPKRDSFGRHMKPVIHRRPPLRASRGSHRPDATHAAPAVTANAVVAMMQREIEAHRKQTAKLEQENNDLRVQLSQTNAEKLEIELKIRAEVGNEMQQQLKHIKTQYREMLERQQSGNDSSSSSTISSVASSQSQSSIDEEERAAWRQEKAAMQNKIRQLQEQLTECEDEMRRIQERHERELDCILLKREADVEEEEANEEEEEEPEEI